MSTPVFWMEPTEYVRVILRTYESRQCVQGRRYCDALRTIVEKGPKEDWRAETIEYGREVYRVRTEVLRPDTQWPGFCIACQFAFTETGKHQQLWADILYSGAPDGKLYTTRDMPVGALYHCKHLSDRPEFTGADGITLMCVTPGGEWLVDSRANNCTMPNDNEHKCWVRHGDPRDPQGVKTGVKLTVDKNGKTCAAGAGSIQCGTYHGFLQNGVLT